MRKAKLDLNADSLKAYHNDMTFFADYIRDFILPMIAQVTKLIKTQQPKATCNGQADKKDTKRCAVKEAPKSVKGTNYTLEDGQKAGCKGREVRAKRKTARI